MIQNNKEIRWGIIGCGDVTEVKSGPAFHRDYTLKVAQTKKPVYVEKPMAMNHAECQEMILSCQKSEVPLFVAYYRRALERFIKIKEIIDQGLLGDIRLVSVLF